jgi:XTP/dITP diphosphohydrolase
MTNTKKHEENMSNAAAKRRIVLATHNMGKVHELAEPLASFGVEVLGLSSFPEIGEIDETGNSFEENALLKARTVALATGLVCVADDSGLEVDALGGAPGIYSARYANDWEQRPGESRDARNIRKLLRELEDIPDSQRTCRFVCAMAAVQADAKETVVRGVWEGAIIQEPRGVNGFGYDPVFFDASMGKTAAEMTREEKNARSHRGKALQALLARWKNFMQ